MFTHQLFEAQVAEAPDSVALTFEGKSLTYRELDNRANQLARYLRRLGVGPEIPVGVCMERAPELVVAVLGLLKAGGVYTSLDPANPKERLSFILQETKPAVVLAQERLIKFLPGHDAREVCLDRDWSDIAEQSTEPLEALLSNENLAFLVYTSGTTGQPKAVMLTHRKRDSGPSHDQTVYQMTKEDRHVLKSSINFTVIIRELFWPLLTGGQLAIMPPGTEQDIAYLAGFIASHRISLITVTPSVLRALLEEPGIRNCDSLRHVICFGEPLTHDLEKRFHVNLSAELSVYYGATEAPSAAMRKCENGVPPNVAGLGNPLPGIKIHLLDHRLQPVPIGICGELYIAGKLARGYFKRPDLTAEKFLPNPFSEEPGARFYRTGDLGRYLPDGSIEFLGRVDDQIKIRGFRVELGEIETVLSQHPGISQVIVTDREVSGDRRLIGYVVPQREHAPSISELRGFLRKKLPHYMVPSGFVFLDNLPLTPNGKVDRRALPAPDRTRSESESGFVAPRDAVELELAQVWGLILGTHPVGVRDNFFDLGGQSLLAARLFAEIQKMFGKSLPLATLFQAPTIEQLANILRQEEWLPSWSSLVAIQPNGSKRPFFCVHAHGGNVLIFNDLARRLGTDQPFYGLQAQGLDGQQTRHTRIEEMAAHYLNEIKTVQPEGPYFLGGYCFGGRVVLEMAQQLHAQGKRVALLAMIDSYAPGYPKLRPWFDREVKQRFLYHWGNLKGTSAKEELDYVLQKGKILKNRLKTFANRRISWLYLTLGIALPPRLQPFQQPKRVRYNYARQTYPGRITMFSPVKGPAWVDHHPDMGWEGLAAEGLDIHEIPGSYAHIISEPFVGELADRLTACIDNARTEP